MPKPTVTWRPYAQSDTRFAEVVGAIDGEDATLGFFWQYPGMVDVCAEIAAGDDDRFPDEATAVRYLQQVAEVMAANGDLDEAIRRLQTLAENRGHLESEEQGS